MRAADFDDRARDRRRGRAYRILRSVGPLRAAVRGMRKLVGRIRIPSWRLEGTERASRQRLVLYFAGHLQSRNYIANLVFEPRYVEQNTGKVWLWSARKRGVGMGADLVAIRRRPRYSRRFRNRLGFDIPCWIGLEADLAVAAKGYATSENLKSDLRRIRLHDFRCESTHDPARIADFYITMYRPYIARVHGDRAMPLTWPEFEPELKKSELLLLHKDGECIAGSLFVDMGKRRARARMVGVKDGDERYVRMGALAALYYFEIQHLIERSYERLHYGASRAFLRDGLLSFKKKFRPRIVDRDAWVFHVEVARWTPGVRAFFTANPFITIEDGSYVGNFFRETDGENGKESLAWEVRHRWIPGMAVQRVHFLDGASGLFVAPADLPVPVQIRNIAGQRRTA